MFLAILREWCVFLGHQRKMVHLWVIKENGLHTGHYPVCVQTPSQTAQGQRLQRDLSYPFNGVSILIAKVPVSESSG